VISIILECQLRRWFGIVAVDMAPNPFRAIVHIELIAMKMALPMSSCRRS
jgi:hypothetical protein